MSGELTLVINVLPEGVQPLLQNIRGFSNEHMTGRVFVSRVYQVESIASPLVVLSYHTNTGVLHEHTHKLGTTSFII